MQFRRPLSQRELKEQEARAKKENKRYALSVIVGYLRELNFQEDNMWGFAQMLLDALRQNDVIRLDIFKDVVESTRALIDVKWEAGEKYSYLYSVIKTKKQEEKDGLNISDDGEEL